MGYIAELRAVVGSRPLIVVGAGILVLDSQNRVLLGRRSDNGFWGIPGGAMEPGESLEQVARRELREETGLEAGALEMFGLFSGADFFYRYPHGDQIHNVAAIYLTRTARGDPGADQTETRELRYFEIPDLPMHNGPVERAAFALLQQQLAKGEL